MSQSNVSAHYVVREDDEATQMVDLADNAWHACTSIGAPSASRGLASRVAALTPLCLQPRRAYSPFCAAIYRFQFAARAGVGPGIASHNDVGAAGGGHRDPSDDPGFTQKFVKLD
jgi:hypothetical protein